VASEASTRTSLEATRQSVEDRTTAVQATAIAAPIEQDSQASRLALAEAEVEKLHATAASAEGAAERARITTSTTETTAGDAAEAAAREKATLEARVSELDRDLVSGTVLRVP
jgi:hypothetical protein